MFADVPSSSLTLVVVVPVTPLRSSYRQDASVWRDAALLLLENKRRSQERSLNIRIALKRDEPSKESHDNVITFCLGRRSLQAFCSVRRVVGAVNSILYSELVAFIVEFQL